MAKQVTSVRVTTLAGSVTYTNSTVTWLADGNVLQVAGTDGSPLVWVSPPWQVEFNYE